MRSSELKLQGICIRETEDLIKSLGKLSTAEILLKNPLQDNTVKHPLLYTIAEDLKTIYHTNDVEMYGYLITDLRIWTDPSDVVAKLSYKMIGKSPRPRSTRNPPKRLEDLGIEEISPQKGSFSIEPPIRGVRGTRLPWVIDKIGPLLFLQGYLIAGGRDEPCVGVFIITNDSDFRTVNDLLKIIHLLRT